MWEYFRWKSSNPFSYKDISTPGLLKKVKYIKSGLIFYQIQVFGVEMLQGSDIQIVSEVSTQFFFFMLSRESQFMNILILTDLAPFFFHTFLF